MKNLYNFINNNYEFELKKFNLKKIKNKNDLEKFILFTELNLEDLTYSYLNEIISSLDLKETIINNLLSKFWCQYLKIFKIKNIEDLILKELEKILVSKKLRGKKYV